MTELLADCLFCNRRELIIAETPSVFIQLDDAPIVEGHVIVCPRLHYPSMADVPPEVAADADRLLDGLVAIYEKVYGPTVIYEHGRTGQCLRRNPGERICHHSHLHVMPLDVNLAAAVELGQHAPFTSLGELAELAGDVEGYIVAGSSTWGRRYFPVTRPMGPHYLRTLASTQAGVPERADWEANLFTDVSRALQSQAAARLEAFRSELAALGSESAANAEPVS
jgi:diadenosine tetraphosphate (Ap4A) HIT family hydrolase